MAEEQIIIHKDTKYRVRFEKAATKGVIGIQCEANGDLLVEVLKEAEELFGKAMKFGGDLEKVTEVNGGEK